MFLPNCRRGIVSFSQHPFAIEDDVTVCQVRVRRMCNFDIKRRRARGRVMVRWDRQYIMCAGAAAVAGLLSVSIANAQSVPDATPLSYSAAEIFAKVLRDQPAAADNRGVRPLRACNGSRSRCRRSTDSTPRSTAMAAEGTTSAASTAQTARFRFRWRSNGACNSTAASEASTIPARPAAPDTCSGATLPSAFSVPTAPIRAGMGTAVRSFRAPHSTSPRRSGR